MDGLSKFLASKNPPPIGTGGLQDPNPAGEAYLLIRLSEVAMVRVSHRDPTIRQNEIRMKSGDSLPADLRVTELLAKKLEDAQAQASQGNPQDGPSDPSGGEVFVKLPL